MSERLDPMTVEYLERFALSQGPARERADEWRETKHMVWFVRWVTSWTRSNEHETATDGFARANKASRGGR